MKATPAQKVKIGMFTAVGILIFFAGIFVLGSKKNMFGETFTVYGIFKNVGGLQVGNNIRFSGINVGTVDGIDIENDSSVRVVMRLQPRVRRYIKSDVVANIGSDGLMGDKLINIVPGSGRGNLLPEGSRLATTNPYEVDKIVGRLSQVVDNASVITSSLAHISTQIKSGRGSIGRLIYTDSLERGLERTVNSAHATIKTAGATIANANSTISTVHEVVDSAKGTIAIAKKGAESFNANMDAAKHSLLLRGFFKKKEKHRKADSTNHK